MHAPPPRCRRSRRSPSLTTIAVDKEALGRRGVELLLEETPAVTEISLPVRLIARGSTTGGAGAAGSPSPVEGHQARGTESPRGAQAQPHVGIDVGVNAAAASRTDAQPAAKATNESAAVTPTSRTAAPHTDAAVLKPR